MRAEQYIDELLGGSKYFRRRDIFVMWLKLYCIPRWSVVSKRVRQWFWPFWILVLSYIWLYDFVFGWLS